MKVNYYPEASAEADNAALHACMDQCMADERYRAQLTAKLREETFFDVACFAAYSIQSENLHLPPNSEPPCVASAFSPTERDRDAQKLLRRMLQAGVSRYAPDPMAALANAKRKRNVTASS